MNMVPVVVFIFSKGLDAGPNGRVAKDFQRVVKLLPKKYIFLLEEDLIITMLNY